jgi:hypothetical protein
MTVHAGQLENEFERDRRGATYRSGPVLFGGAMEAYQERVITERDQLSDKINKLRTFLLGAQFAGLPLADRHLLKRQFLVMEEYRDILNERIHAFGDPDAA